MYASAKKVDNIISTVDMNGQQIDGSTDNVLNMGSLRAKFEAFGWDVIDLEKGNDIAAVAETLKKAKEYSTDLRRGAFILALERIQAKM